MLPAETLSAPTFLFAAAWHGDHPIADTDALVHAAFDPALSRGVGGDRQHRHRRLLNDWREWHTHGRGLHGHLLLLLVDQTLLMLELSLLRCHLLLHESHLLVGV